MAVIGAFDPAQLVPQAALGHFAPDTERGELGPCGAPQVVEREGPQAVRHALQSYVQRIETDMRYPLARVAPALREQIFAAGRDRLELPEPTGHLGHERNIEGGACLGTRRGKMPDRASSRAAVEIKFFRPGAQQFAFADAEREQQFEGKRVGGAEARRFADLLEKLRQLIEAQGAAAGPLGAASIEAR